MQPLALAQSWRGQRVQTVAGARYRSQRKTVTGQGEKFHSNSPQNGVRGPLVWLDRRLARPLWAERPTYSLKAPAATATPCRA
jgi:hypothetical protein